MSNRQINSNANYSSEVLLSIMRRLGLDEEDDGYVQKEISYSELVSFRKQAVMIADRLTQQCVFCVITDSSLEDATRTFKILKHLDNIELMHKDKAEVDVPVAVTEDISAILVTQVEQQPSVVSAEDTRDITTREESQIDEYDGTLEELEQEMVLEITSYENEELLETVVEDIISTTAAPTVEAVPTRPIESDESVASEKDLPIDAVEETAVEDIITTTAAPTVEAVPNRPIESDESVASEKDLPIDAVEETAVEDIITTTAAPTVEAVPNRPIESDESVASQKDLPIDAVEETVTLAEVKQVEAAPPSPVPRAISHTDYEELHDIVDTDITADVLGREHAFLLNEIIRLRDVLQSAIDRLAKGARDNNVPASLKTGASRHQAGPHLEATLWSRQQLDECIDKLVSVRRYFDECSASEGFDKLRALVARPARCCDMDDDMLHIHGFLNNIPVVINLDQEGSTSLKRRVERGAECMCRVVAGCEESQEVLLTGCPSVGMPYYPTVRSLPCARDPRAELLHMDSAKLALAAEAAPCCRQAALDEASDDELPYVVSRRSLPVDCADLDAIRETIRRRAPPHDAHGLQ